MAILGWLRQEGKWMWARQTRELLDIYEAGLLFASQGLLLANVVAIRLGRGIARYSGRAEFQKSMCVWWRAQDRAVYNLRRAISLSSV